MKYYLFDLKVLTETEQQETYERWYKPYHDSYDDFLQSILSDDKAPTFELNLSNEAYLIRIRDTGYNRIKIESDVPGLVDDYFLNIPGSMLQYALKKIRDKAGQAGRVLLINYAFDD